MIVMGMVKIKHAIALFYQLREKVEMGPQGEMAQHSMIQSLLSIVVARLFTTAMCRRIELSECSGAGPLKGSGPTSRGSLISPFSPAGRADRARAGQLWRLKL